jgi:hypothetical protein
LEARGLVRRARPSDDHRFVAVEITDAGRHELHRLRAHWTPALEQALGQLSEGEVVGLAAASETLQRLIDLLVAAAPIDDDPPQKRSTAASRNDPAPNAEAQREVDTRATPGENERFVQLGVVRSSISARCQRWREPPATPLMR